MNLKELLLISNGLRKSGSWPVSRSVRNKGLSMNYRICRQVLECGDGVREVTAWVVAALKIAKRALTQSGDSEDSVAAVQDARAPTRSTLGSRSPCAVRIPWRLSP